MEFDRKTTWGIFLAILVLATIGMTFTPMATNTIFMMVVPSMVVFGIVVLWLGIQHGEYLSHP